MSEEKKEGEKEYISEDVIELRGIFSAIVDFLRELSTPLKELMSIVQSGIAGDKLGKDIAEFYRNLKESGLPDEIIVEMVKKYYDDRMSLLRLINRLFEELRKGRVAVAATSGKGEAKELIKEVLKGVTKERERE